MQQQCPKGFFRLTFSDKADAVQSCAGAPKADRAPDTDATAIAVLALSEVKGPKAKTAWKKGVAWLVDHQKPDGSFGGGTSTKGANTNSTGLAGWALGEAGAKKQAAAAAVWVRGLQVPRTNPCAGKLGGDIHVSVTTGPISSDVDIEQLAYRIARVIQRKQRPR